MVSSINLTAIIVANMMGIMTLLVLLAGNRWRLREQTKENRILRILITFSIVSCIVDPFCAAFDGVDGGLSRGILFAGNTWLYMMNLLLGPLWVALVANHLYGKLTKLHKALIYSMDLLGAVFLIANFFVPIVFGIDEYNRYYRGPLYWYYIVMEVLFIIDGVVYYLTARRKGGLLKFFPVNLFVLPGVVGIITQSCFYGISTIWPSIAIAIGGVMAGLQNELIFRDGLTGLYNRFYLDNMKKGVIKMSNTVMTAMMLDINSFKSINDNYGHRVGDEALKNTATILAETVGNLGSVIRYAGDEFVVLANIRDEDEIAKLAEGIRAAFAAFNEKHEHLYTLTLSIGTCLVDLKEQSIDELMNVVDKRMYEEKRRYYAEGNVE